MFEGETGEFYIKKIYYCKSRDCVFYFHLI